MAMFCDNYPLTCNWLTAIVWVAVGLAIYVAFVRYMLPHYRTPRWRQPPRRPRRRRHRSH